MKLLVINTVDVDVFNANTKYNGMEKGCIYEYAEIISQAIHIGKTTFHVKPNVDNNDNRLDAIAGLICIS